MSRLDMSAGAAKPSTLSSPDLLKLKHYLINTLSRELEGNNVPFEERKEFSQQRLNEIYQSANLKLPEDIRKHIFKEVGNELWTHPKIAQ